MSWRTGISRDRYHLLRLMKDVRAKPASEALAELTRRYFTSRGPATVRDFLRWSSLTAADARNGIAMVKPKLEHQVVDGWTYWFAPSSSGASPATPVIDLVQVYDEYVMSYSESRDVLSAQSAAPEVRTYADAILLDGQLIGNWKHVFQKNAATVETGLYRRLNGLEKRALESALERYVRFLGMAATFR